MKQLLFIGILHLTFTFVVAMVEEENSPSLLWYVPSPNITNRFECKSEAESGNQVVEGGPLFVQPNQTSICVYFSIPNKWFLHEGLIGSCTNQCCEWLPPIGPNGKFADPSPSSGIKWYLLAADQEECNTFEYALNTPRVLEGKLGDNKTVCVSLPEKDEEFLKVQVTLSLCGGRCCIF